MLLLKDGVAPSWDPKGIERPLTAVSDNHLPFTHNFQHTGSSSLVLRCRSRCRDSLIATILALFLLSTAEAQNNLSWSQTGLSESHQVGEQSGFFQPGSANLNGIGLGTQTSQTNPSRDWQSATAPDAMESPVTGTASGLMEKSPSWSGSAVTEGITNPPLSPASRPTEQAPLSGNESIPLRRANEKGDRLSSRSESASSFGSRTAPWLTTSSALAIVLGTLFLFYWGMKRLGPKTGQLLPAEAIEMLGYTSLSGRQRLCLIRVGRKLVLVAVSSDAIEPLTEIDDPVEVDRLVGLCASQRNGSATQVFHQVFSQYVNHPTSTG